MTPPCTPFAVVWRQGIARIERPGCLSRPATPEEVYLWERQAENLVEMDVLSWGVVWALRGKWANDPEQLRDLSGALLRRAEALAGRDGT